MFDGVKRWKVTAMDPLEIDVLACPEPADPRPQAFSIHIGISVSGAGGAIQPVDWVNESGVAWVDENGIRWTTA